VGNQEGRVAQLRVVSVEDEEGLRNIGGKGKETDPAGRLGVKMGDPLRSGKDIKEKGTIPREKNAPDLLGSYAGETRKRTTLKRAIVPCYPIHFRGGLPINKGGVNGE